ncbi:MAG TPA: histidine phosphatase family protein [Verrucomicrobiae bacterium]|nr:histidine phosphatase family protein [Verrucomicrobiae bacterium]
MPLYFLRHGQSQANLNGLFAGQKENSPLTDLGRQQAQAAAKTLQDRHITTIVSSPLERARETAAIVAASLGIRDVSIDSRLAEYDMGALTGTPNKGKTVTSRELISAEGAEDPQLFQQRVLDAVAQYGALPGAVVLVSHAGVGRVIEASKQGLAPDVFYDLPSYPNAQAVELDIRWMSKR